MRNYTAAAFAAILFLWAALGGVSSAGGPDLGAGLSAPSPNGSPVANLKQDVLRTDGRGNLWVRLVGGGGASGNTTLQPGTEAANVTLPAASPVLVRVQPSPVVLASGTAAVNVTLPAASPVPVLVAPSPIVIASGTAAQNVTLPAASPVPVQFGVTGSTTSGSHSAVSVDTTSTGTQVIASNSTMRGWIVQNADTATGCYLGLGSVSSSNGYYLAPGATFGATMADGYNGQVKAISASGTISVRVMFW